MDGFAAGFSARSLHEAFVRQLLPEAADSAPNQTGRGGGRFPQLLRDLGERQSFEMAHRGGRSLVV